MIMKYLKTYEFFDFFKKKEQGGNNNQTIDQDILDECYDILLELKDKGYDIDVKELQPGDVNGDIYIILSTKPEKFNREGESVSKEELYDQYYTLYENEIVPVMDIVEEYLSEKGFVPTTNEPPKRFISRMTLAYRFYFKNKITASAVAR